METINNTFTIQITKTDKVCGIGEEMGRKHREEGKTPVFSCEGGCIKGEIARLTANLIAKESQYARACHGELFAVPHSQLAKWVKEADKVVIIDGCAIQCHKRIAENIIAKEKLVDFDTLSIHKKFSDLMEIDEVSETERKQTAKTTANVILTSLREGTSCTPDPQFNCGCGHKSLKKVNCSASSRD